jgi:hypothetical protein
MGEMNQPVIWVKLKKYCELAGDTPAAVHAQRQVAGRRAVPHRR